MSESALSLQEVKGRFIKSFFSLFARQVILRALGFISINIILAKILSPGTLGIFNIATGVISFFAFFSDIGLAASLIQKKDQVTQEDISTTFSVQQLLVLTITVSLFILAPFLGQFYNFDDSGIWLIRSLAVAFLLSSLKVIPSVLAERQLRFQPLVAVEVVETLIFNSLLIVLVYKGWGIWSFSVAAIARGLAGVILIYILVPIKLGVGISRQAASGLLRFGIPYQINSFLALIKDRLTPLVVAGMVGSTGVGYITWAQSLAFLPLEAMNIIVRIAFPAFSRLQDDKAHLSQAVEKSLFVTTLFVYPALFGLAAIMPKFILTIVSSKWAPSLESFYLFAFATLWSVISTVLTNALNAIGQVKMTLKLMVMWTVLTWLLTPLLVWLYGFNGVAITAFIISFSSAISIMMIKRFLSVRVIQAVGLPLICSALMGGIVYVYSNNFVNNRYQLIGAVVLGGLVYLGLVGALGNKRVLEDIRSLRQNG